MIYAITHVDLMQAVSVTLLERLRSAELPRAERSTKALSRPGSQDNRDV
jgi:hypothetical protein